MQLLWQLTQGISFIGLTAFLLMRLRPFRRLLAGSGRIRDRLLLGLIFGLIAMMGTYMGVPVQGAIANSRVIGAAVGGLLGGPWVGLLAGLIGGGHRFAMGGFTALACGLSTVLEGLFAGLVHRKAGVSRLDWRVGLATGFLAEMLQMGIILALSRPFGEALSLVQVIILPMTVVNAGGVALFLLILSQGIAAEERIASFHTHKVLEIARATLPHLRRGLAPDSAEQVARIIYEATGAAAVAITDRLHVLAHIGVGSDHHRPGDPIQTAATRHGLESGQVQMAATRDEIGCAAGKCPLASGLVMPLIVRGQPVGTLKLYALEENSLSPRFVELASGMAALFSTQLELAELERQAQMTTRAELKALRAQINPHFLFNALNTISSFVRTKPEGARELLGHLADFFRRTLRSGDELVPLAEELELVECYLKIERARFGERLRVTVDLHPSVLRHPIPPFTLQPLVENAVKYGLMPRSAGGTIRIEGRLVGDAVLLSVSDDGEGMEPAMAEAALAGWSSGRGNGIGLTNVNERLKGYFGTSSALQIQTAPGHGTRVLLRLPAQTPPAVVGLIKKEG